jgi:hypothetical protein
MFNDATALVAYRIAVAAVVTVVELRDRGVIGADVLRRLERHLDLEAMLLGDPASDGQK